MASGSKWPKELHSGPRSNMALQIQALMQVSCRCRCAADTDVLQMQVQACCRRPVLAKVQKWVP